MTDDAWRDEDAWRDVDAYLAQTVFTEPAIQRAALKANAAAGLPPIDVSPCFGKFLNLLVRISGARRVLEIGTLGGYSTLWFAEALPSDGVIVTLELEPAHAEVARGNLRRAGLLDHVDIRIGPARKNLDHLTAEGAASFDLVFIDADKDNNPAYLEAALALTRPGSVIVLDNVVRDGRVLDAGSDDPAVLGARRALRMMADDPRLDATALQSVGVKGWDGFALALVCAAESVMRKSGSGFSSHHATR